MSDENLLEITPSQSEEGLELDTTVTPDEELENQGDPLDKIEDVAELRAKAKGYRAAFHRSKGKKEEPVEKKEPVVQAPVSDFMTKADFQKANQKKAIRLATEVSSTDSEEVKKMKEDILENFEHVKTFYTPRRGKDTPEDIYEDLKDAHTLSLARRPATKTKPDTTVLVATQIQGTGEARTDTVKKDPPGYKTPVQPSDWYKKS